VDPEESFRTYVSARLAALSRVAFLLTGDWHLAEDLVQVTLVRVARHWERVAGTGDPDPYVRRARGRAGAAANRGGATTGRRVPSAAHPGLV
jgi:DNA-directed RNA polymerase specialized sigma24 family protein